MSRYYYHKTRLPSNKDLLNLAKDTFKGALLGSESVHGLVYWHSEPDVIIINPKSVPVNIYTRYQVLIKNVVVNMTIVNE